MIKSIKRIRNLGPFETVENVKLGKVTLIYAENGRGKTMLSEALRSLATGAPELVAGRSRLGSDAEPVIVLGLPNDEEVRWTQTGWQPNGKLPKVSVFNDGFVDANVYSGLDVTSSHRQGLHSVVVGEDGIAKTKAYEDAVKDSTDRLKDTKRISEQIQTAVHGVPDVDAYCREKMPPDIEKQISENTRKVNAAKRVEQVGERRLLTELKPPSLPVAAVRKLLGRGLSELTGDAVDRVRHHLDSLWDGGESWIHEGWKHGKQDDHCPYCGQSLSGVQLVTDFADHFEGAYAQFKKEIADFQSGFEVANSETHRRLFVDRAAEIEELHREWIDDGVDKQELLDFRAKETADRWQSLSEGVSRALSAKSGEPLEVQRLDDTTKRALKDFEVSCKQIESENRKVQAINLMIKQLKNTAKSADLKKLSEEAQRLERLRRRGEPDVVELCGQYEDAWEARRSAVKLRDQNRKVMEGYNKEIFRRYGKAINDYLRKFGTGFRIDGFKEAKPMGRVTSAFNIPINRVPVPVKSENLETHEPSFRNTLSAGDRNALALACFLASGASVTASAIVLDDPMSSLDVNRRTATVDELRDIAMGGSQLIVLSHDRSFLCHLYTKLPGNRHAITLEVAFRHGKSEILTWDAREACVQEEVARSLRIQRFTEGSGDAPDILKRDLRLYLEHYLKTIYPSAYMGVNNIRGFIGRCNDLLKEDHVLMPHQRLTELRKLVDFVDSGMHEGNHSSTNKELITWSKRVLAFSKGEDA